MVGATGFEPTTPGSQNQCSSQTELRPETESHLSIIFAKLEHFERKNFIVRVENAPILDF